MEHRIAAGMLGQPITVLVADDLGVFRRQPRGFRGGEFDDFDRNPGRVEEGRAVVTGVGFLRRRPPSSWRVRA